MNYPTFLILNLNDSLDCKKFSKFILDNFNEYEVFVASNVQHEYSINVNEYIVDKKTNADSIINSIIPKINGEELVLVRDIKDNNFDELLDLLKSNKRQNEIVLFKKKKNKVRNWFFEKFNKFLNLAFGYKLYDGSLNKMCFSSIPLNILKQLKNPSTYTKINKWKGIKLISKEKEKVDKIRFKVPLKLRIVRISFEFVMLITPILCWIFIPYSKSLLLYFFYVFLIVVAVFLLGIEFMMWHLKTLIGENVTKKVDL